MTYDNVKKSIKKIEKKAENESTSKREGGLNCKVLCAPELVHCTENQETKSNPFSLYFRRDMRCRAAYRHTVLEQSTIVSLEGSDWTSESDVTILCLFVTPDHSLTDSFNSEMFFV
ncbi:hypothetical protein AVEN_135056-1 [Araneus ventricosus]|uniref:Uncharacterized protein n=1 Tax=Araneus ventricosus TaxID=182803 RepID=A0A4Y2CZL9_ARAVE|nr:hypothetical protein AVEN_135056-1 [Araneus ventricosus]